MRRNILITFIACCAAIAMPVNAQFATGGSGAHKDKIFWLRFGTVGQNVFAGVTVTRSLDVGGVPFVTTCVLSNAQTISGFSANLNVYLPGSWQGDGFDELYNIGGNNPGTGGGTPNTLAAGLSSANSGISFDVSCSATFDGAPFPLKGLVFSDAEASGGGEYTAARLTNGGTLRIIDQISQCGTNTGVSIPTVGGFPEIRFGAPTVGTSCENNGNALLRGGPLLVGFLDGATRAKFTVLGGGVSAIALGVVARFDISEAIPLTYGVAIHQLEQPFVGGVATAGVNYNTVPANLATLGDRTSLGPTVLPDSGVIQPIGSSDTDALPKTTGPAGVGYANVTLPNPVNPGTTTYTINNVSCDGTSSRVAGWIDFNGNGVFNTGERSAIVPCTGGTGTTISLTWTLPADYRPQLTSFMRLRIAIDPNFLASATGIANNGEAEDYRITLPGISNLSITKTNTPGVNGDIDQTSDTVQSGAATTYTITARNNGPTAADGAVVTDPALTGLNCPTGPVTCSASGGAVCPTSPTVMQLQTGLAIPTLPLNGSVVFTLACTVTATGF